MVFTRMKKKVTANTILFAILLAVPLIGEYSTATPAEVPGTGFDILLYKPFDFAYLILAGLLFSALNGYLYKKTAESVLKGIGIGVVIGMAWFAIAFLSVGQLHLSLGGIL